MLCTTAISNMFTYTTIHPNVITYKKEMYLTENISHTYAHTLTHPC